MKTKKVNVSMIVEIENNAFEELAKCVDHHIETFINTDEWPEIKSISNAKIKEINEKDINNGIEKREFDNYTVGEVIDILSTFPSNYEFLNCRESNYVIWVDHNSGTVSIDRKGKDWIDEQIKNIQNNI